MSQSISHCPQAVPSPLRRHHLWIFFQPLKSPLILLILSHYQNLIPPACLFMWGWSMTDNHSTFLHADIINTKISSISGLNVRMTGTLLMCVMHAETWWGRQCGPFPDHMWGIKRGRSDWDFNRTHHDQLTLSRNYSIWWKGDGVGIQTFFFFLPSFKFNVRTKWIDVPQVATGTNNLQKILDLVDRQILHSDELYLSFRHRSACLLLKLLNHVLQHVPVCTTWSLVHNLVLEVPHRVMVKWDRLWRV